MIPERDAEWADLVADLDEQAQLEAAAQAAYEFEAPVCSVCGTTLHVVPDGTRSVACSWPCAIEIARREEQELEEPPVAD